MSQRLIESLRRELERRHHRLLAAENDLQSAKEDFDEVYELLETALMFNNETGEDNESTIDREPSH